ncbi:MAG: hypothetical protein WCS01_12080 [bacterium]
MSTISDALKKAQTQRTAGPPAVRTPPVPAGPENVPPPPGQAPPGRMYPVLVGLLAVVALFLALQLWRPHKGSRPEVSEKQEGAPVRPVPAAMGPMVSALPEGPVQALVPGVMTQTVVKAWENTATPPVPEVKAGGLPVVTQLEAGATETIKPPPEAPPKTPAKRPPLSVPVLNGTFYSPRNPVAIINGESIKVGETVGGYQVLEIREESVKLGYDGEEFVIKLK